jgi:hypothetical protein
MAKTPIPEHDLDLISKATGLLTIELAFLLVFLYGSLAPTDYGDTTTGFLNYRGPSYVTTVLVLSALTTAPFCAAATLVAVARDSGLGNRFIRMSAGLLGVAGLGFGVHILLAILATNEMTSSFALGLVILAAVMIGLLWAAWRFSAARTD